jgi:hypothetical protein
MKRHERVTLSSTEAKYVVSSLWKEKKHERVTLSLIEAKYVGMKFHIQHMKHLVIYVQETKDLGITYLASQPLLQLYLTCYSNGGDERTL